MQLVKYIGEHLKSNLVIELLEEFDMSVVYDFDRLHENIPDSYSSAAKEAGFEIRFNDQQIVDVVWCYIEPRHGYSPVKEDSLGVPIFRNFADARSYASESGTQLSESDDQLSWLCIQYDNFWIHYEFSSGRLSLITLMLN